MAEALEFMGLESGNPIRGQAIDVAFIGSCTNSRLSDLREAQRSPVAPAFPRRAGLVVPGSQQVAEQAEAEGLTASSARRGSSGGRRAVRCAWP
ncbi:MAG: hypothetical protein CM1200mP2_50070 [Planctomycetaceae bacterium]|nr:MAG: hypothetical protein CM1200mP2_50070 [Planctomycetaceae bacterium]